LVLAGRWALDHGRRALRFGGAVAALAGLSIALFSPLILAVHASVAGLSGAALGLGAGVFVAEVLLCAAVASAGVRGQAAGARGLSIAAVFATAGVVFCAFDGEISRIEGALMIVGAVVVAALRAKRSGASPAQPAGFWAPSLWLAAGAALTLFGAALAIDATGILSTGRPDGDLVIGLSALALAVALADLAHVFPAARRGEGGVAIVEIAGGGAFMLLGVLGAAALLKPIAVPESFLGAPAIAMAVSALVLLGLGLWGAKIPKPAAALGGVAYAAFLWAFVTGAG
jgi:cation:H+ antiporter